MAAMIEPSPLGGLGKSETAPSALLNRHRLKTRQVRTKGKLKFKDTAVWHYYESYGTAELTGNESTSEESLKAHIELGGWVHLWNEIQGEKREFIDLSLSNFKKLNWAAFEHSMLQANLSFLTFLQQKHGLFKREEDAPLLQVFEQVAKLKALNVGYVKVNKNISGSSYCYTYLGSIAWCRMDIPNTAYRHTSIIASLFRRNLSRGTVGELIEVLELLAKKGLGLMSVPAALSKVLPVEPFAYKMIATARKDEDFRHEEWDPLIDFFTDPIKMFVRERNVYQQRYIKLLHEGLSFALLDNNVLLARRLHRIKIPQYFEQVLEERDDQCIVRHLDIPDNIYDRAQRFGRSGNKLFIKLIRLGAEDVVLDWMEDRSHPNVLVRKFDDGQCLTLSWENSNARIEVYKYPENAPNRKAFEKRHWGVKVEYELVTPLQCAMETGNARLVEKMLEKGANPFQENNCSLRGYFSLRYAPNGGGSKSERANRSVCKRLLLDAVDKRFSWQQSPPFPSAQAWWDSVELQESARMGSSKYMRRFMEKYDTNVASIKSSQGSQQSEDASQLQGPPTTQPLLPLNRRNSRHSIVSRTSTLTGFYGGSFSRATWTRSLRYRTRKGAKHPEPGTHFVQICTNVEVVAAITKAVDSLMRYAFSENSASNGQVLRGVGVLLKHSKVFLNRTRYQQIADLVLKALVENKGGDQDALIYILFDCELLNILLNKNRILSNPKYVKPIRAAIEAEQVPREDRTVAHARKMYKKEKTGAAALDVVVDKAMRLDGHKFRTLRLDLKVVDAERENLDFVLDNKFTERTLMLSIAKHGLYKLFLAYQFEHQNRLHSGLAETMMRCAIAFDETCIVERLLEGSDENVLRVARQATLDSGYHEKICEMAVEASLKKGEEGAEECMVDFFTSKAKDATIGKFMQVFLPGGDQTKLPPYVTQDNCTNALMRVFNSDDELNAKAANELVLSAMFVNFPSMFTLGLLEAGVAKLLRTDLRGSKTKYYKLYQTLREGCHEEIGHELAERCESIEEWAPHEERGYASDDQVSPFL